MSSTTRLLLQEVEEYCRSAGIAESTFGRQAVNDGKLCNRLRAGKNITLETAQRVHDYIHQQQPQTEDQPLDSSDGGSKEIVTGSKQDRKSTRVNSSHAA